jgi:hypothetical protein
MSEKGQVNKPEVANLDLGRRFTNVRFTPNSGHSSARVQCLRHAPQQKFRHLLRDSPTRGAFDANTLLCPHASFGPFPGKFTGIT